MSSVRSFARSLAGFLCRGSVELLFDSFRSFLHSGSVNFLELFSVKVLGVGMDGLSRVVRSLKSFVRSSYGTFTGSMVLSGGLRYFRIVLSFNLSSVNCLCCSSWTPFTTLEVQHGWLVL